MVWLKILSKDQRRQRAHKQILAADAQMQKVMVSRISNAWASFAGRRHTCREASASAIQRVYRGSWCRGVLLRTLAARILQRHVRCLLAQWRTERAALRTKSAVRIQRAFLARLQLRCLVLQRLAHEACAAARSREQRRITATAVATRRRIAAFEKQREEALRVMLAEREEADREKAASVISGHIRARIWRRRVRQSACSVARARLVDQVSEASCTIERLLEPRPDTVSVVVGGRARRLPRLRSAPPRMITNRLSGIGNGDSRDGAKADHTYCRAQSARSVRCQTRSTHGSERPEWDASGMSQLGRVSRVRGGQGRQAGGAAFHGLHCTHVPSARSSGGAWLDRHPLDRAPGRRTRGQNSGGRWRPTRGYPAVTGRLRIA
jgi:hypothetical protein